ALRWRIDGIRLGSLSLTADFPVWSFARAYLLFYFWVVILAAIVGALAAAGFDLTVLEAESMVTQIVGAILLVIAYFVIVTLVSFAYQATVRLVTWRVIADSLVLHGVDQLDRVRAPPSGKRHHVGIGAAINLGGF